MKLVVAHVRPRMFEHVVVALNDIALLGGVSISDIRGFGHGRAVTGPDQIAEGALTLMPRTRVEVACVEATVDAVVATIGHNGHTGRHGGGKIYVLDLEHAVGISTGERGEAAI